MKHSKYYQYYCHGYCYCYRLYNLIFFWHYWRLFLYKPGAISRKLQQVGLEVKLHLELRQCDADRLRHYVILSQV